MPQPLVDAAELARHLGVARSFVYDQTGIGALVLGFLTTLNEASTGVHDFLEFDKDVGPLSGKTIIAVIAYLASWAVLHGLWRRQNPALRPVLILTVVFIVLGILGTFPTFFQAFASE